MHFWTILFLITFLVGTPNSLEYSCSSKSEQCSENPDVKYLFFDASSQEGFNLRRDVYMRYAIMFAEMQNRSERLNWKLVLPPFYRLPHWRNDNYHTEPIQWGSFFDLASLKSYAPVVEIKDVFKDELPLIDRVYILQNYENAFENGHFAEKWDIIGKCDYLSESFWGYVTKTIETVCVKFQGKVSKLWELISLHPSDKSVMIYHAEIPLHDSYGTKSYWDCRKSMKFNPDLIEAAMEYTEKYLQCYSLKCDTYISVHWRRGDFTYSRKGDIPSIEGTVKQINNAVKKQKLRTKNVFVATDGNSSDMRPLQRGLEELGYDVFLYLPHHMELNKFRDGGKAIIDQIICSHAVYFIGSHKSTFTYRIQEER